MNRWHAGLSLIIIATTGSSAAFAQAPAGGGAVPLAGTSWQLVRFEGGDDTVLTPDDRSKFCSWR